MPLLAKLKRVEAVLKVKKADMEKESLLLAELLAEHSRLEKHLSHCQQAYLTGVAELNLIRQRMDRRTLPVFEQAVDHCRDQWFVAFQEVQRSERKLAGQRQALAHAHNALKATEKIWAKYNKEWQAWLTKRESEFFNDFHLGHTLKQRKGHV